MFSSSITGQSVRRTLFVMTTQASISRQKGPLLTLPAELRMAIYENALTHQSPLPIEVLKAPKLIPLLATCKRILHEAKHSIPKLNVFSISANVTERGDFDFLSELEGLPPNLRQRISSLTLTLHLTPLFRAKLRDSNIGETFEYRNRDVHQVWASPPTPLPFPGWKAMLERVIAFGVATSALKFSLVSWGNEDEVAMGSNICMYLKRQWVLMLEHCVKDLERRRAAPETLLV